jgi:hypothetical protein
MKVLQPNLYFNNAVFDLLVICNIIVYIES